MFKHRVVTCLAILAFCLPQLPGQVSRIDASHSRAKAARLPVEFEPNQGQWGADALYIVRSGVLSGSIRKDGLDLVVPGSDNHGHKIGIRFAGFAKKADVTAYDPLPGRSNYLLGNDPSAWRRNVPTFGRVRYTGVYPGTDAVFYGHDGELEHDFIVRPGADPKAIGLRVLGLRGSTLLPGGDLKLSVGSGDLILKQPRAYQEFGGERREVAASYVLSARGTIGFRVGPYDRKQPLVIDPVLNYATYLDGLPDYVSGIATDAAGDTYITGLTFSASFPTTAGAFQRTCSGCNSSTAVVFVTELNPAGTAQVYSTLLGGSNYNQTSGIAVDASGDAIVTGHTWSNDFPVKNSVQAATTGNNQYGFITSLSPDGSALNYSSLLGPSGFTYANAVAVDSAGNAYITGITDSSSYPVTSGALNNAAPQYPNDVVFVSKFTPAGALGYSALVGDSEPQNGGGGLIGSQAIAVDSQGSAYITGGAGTLYPTTSGAYLTSLPSTTYRGAFVSKLHPDGSVLDYSTFLGLGGGLHIALDANNDAWVAGTADTSSFPTTPNAYSTQSNAGSNFFSEISPDGSQLAYSSFFPATITDIKIDGSANVWLAGTAPNAFPLVNPIVGVFPYNPYPASGSPTSFLLQFNPTATQIKFSTLIGDLSGSGMQIAIDSAGKAHVAGTTIEPIYTSPGAFLSSVTPAPQFVEYTYPYAMVIDPTPTNPAICIAGPAGLGMGLRFTTQPLNTSSTQTVQVQNCGNASLTIQSVSASGSAFTVPAGQNQCTTALAPAATCTVQVSFMPTAAQSYSSSLTFTSNSSVATTTIPLAGSGGVPVAAFVEGPTYYPTLVGQTSRSGFVWLKNQGTVPLTIDLAHITLTGDFTLTSNSCPASLYQWQFCQLGIAFAPTAAGTRTGVLTVPTNDPVHPDPSLTLSATALATYPVPTVSYVSSPTIAVNSGKANVVVAGTNFFPASVVSVNGIAQNTTFDSDTFLEFTLDTSVLSATSPVSVTVTNPAPGGGTSAPVTITGYISIPLSATALVSDSVGGMLYAAIPSTATKYASTVLPIDPTTGNFGTPIPVASSPRNLALSPDGAYLYVGGATSLQRINLKSQAVDRNLPLPTDPTWGQTGVQALQVVPGSPQSVVAALNANNAYDFSGVALFNDSSLVQWIGDHDSKFPTIDSLAFAGSAGQLYGLPAAGSYFPTLQVTSTGLTYTGGAPVTSPGAPSGNAVTSDGTHLYTTWGQVWDPSTQKQVGTFLEPNGGSLNWVDQVLPDANSGRTFLVDPEVSYYEYVTLAIDAYKSSDLSYISGLAFPSISAIDAGNLVRWGADGFAFLSYEWTNTTPQNNQLVIFHSAAIAGAPPSSPAPVLASITPSTVHQGGSSVTLQLTGSGFVNASTVQVNGSARPTTFVSSTQLQASLPATDFATMGTLKITVNTPAPGGGTSAAVALSVVAPVPVASLSTNSLSFGNVNEGSTSSAQTVTLSNSGTAALTITSIQASGDFAASNPCGNSVAAGSSCTIAVTFTPTAAGDRTGTLTLTDNAGDSPQKVILIGSGVAPVSIGTAPGGSTSSTVTSGSTANYSLSLAGSSGFNGAVTLACSGAPQYATCTVSPATLTLASGSSSNFSVSVSTSTQTGSLRQESTLVLAGFGILALFTLPLLPRRKRSILWLICLLSISCSVLSMAACGGGAGSQSGSGGGTSQSNTPPGNYTLTVTATAGTTTVTQSLNLVVK